MCEPTKYSKVKNLFKFLPADLHFVDCLSEREVFLHSPPPWDCPEYLVFIIYVMYSSLLLRHLCLFYNLYAHCNNRPLAQELYLTLFFNVE